MLSLSGFILAESHTETTRMEKTFVIFMITLLCNTSNCASNNCKSLDFVISFRGRYCPMEGRIIANISWHQCKLSCLQTARCEAANYNLSFNICSYVSTPCAKAISHPGMAYISFTGKQPQQCIEWIPKVNVNPMDDRLVTEDKTRYIIRMQKNGNDYIGHLLVGYYRCISADDQGSFKSPPGSYPCQYLRIQEGCTVLYVTYELGTRLPPNTLIGGYTAEGVPLYIGRPVGDSVSGYYIQGTNRVITGRGIFTENVEILASL